jgi:hypothetical protein
MRRLILFAVAIGLLGGTAMAASSVDRGGHVLPDLPWVQFATVAQIEDATAKMAYGVQNRPAVLLETEYYVYPYEDPDTEQQVTTPTLMLSMNSGGYPHPVTLYLYWQNRKTGQRLYVANGVLQNEGVVQDIFGTTGTPILAPNLTDFQFFGPQGAWGAGPSNPTGLYMFGLEVRDVTGAQVIARGYALYNHIDGFVNVTADVLTDTTWTNNNAYVLNKGGEDFPVHVGGKGQQGDTESRTPTTLTIEPGTVVYGNKGNLGTLSVARGSKLIANGTPLMPIIFTSQQLVGDRSSGDWGGLVLNGWAPVGSETGEREGEGETGFFGGGSRTGGADPYDSSGVLCYVRVEFAGVLFTTEDELNGIALQGVGAGTVIKNVQVNRNADDGIEFYGGTVNAGNVLLTGIEDDSFDWTYGWNGYVKDTVIWQGGRFKGDQGIEADNEKSVPDREPRSMPKIFNATFVASFADVEKRSGQAALFRRGTAGIIRNAIFMDFLECGPTVWWQETYDQIDNGDLVIANSILYNNGTDKCTPGDDDPGALHDPDAVDDWLNDDRYANLFVDPMLADPHNPLVPDLHPVPGGPADDAMNGSPFEYIGGLAPGSNWIYEPWTTFAQD